ncbi:PaaI family thioesterase [Afifella pfennigii]|uniref:PaaI family thioesterase n=1 Tax=Afifella pfennigii TaxID=209897 RepID=UPI00047C9A56|nr:acyl-CoA thioesterase domain-containing protein [Afifella pfennigii]
MYAAPIEASLVRVMQGRIAHDDELGVRYGVTKEGGVSVELPFAPFLSDPGQRHVGVGPLVTILDSVCGIGTMMALDFRESTATVDLRVDYLRSPAEGASCRAVARPVEIGGRPGAGMVMMRAEVCEADGREPFAHAVGRFIRRRLPNVPALRCLPPSRPRATAPDYRVLMGFAPAEDGGLLMPYRPGLVGNGSLPSLHGGAVAAHLQQAACDAVAARSERPARLATAHFSFLRFAGAADTVAAVTVERLGASVACVRAVSCQEPGRAAASGVFTFIFV